MTPSSFATVLFRFLGVWLVLASLLVALDAAFLRWSLAGAATPGWTSYPPLPDLAATFSPDSNLFLHDTYYTMSGAPFGLGGVLSRIILGALLILLGGPLGRWLAPRERTQNAGDSP